ncbi:hypothetical protein DUI87_07648 [Hirundo rustica rustica]|uniref:Trafficking protein particle complex subunit 8 n=1 Tax=Hirundo rustica rustica TaxID=333673 RepID=A0A3M0KQT4_HIRRU|nr:hypothetical protein DUI87_07648 [Hirundo rustica rustica]
MAQCVQSVQEFIQDSFVPLVAALCSEEAERLTRRNNLSFAELVRPFCRLTSEVHMRDPNNQLHIIKNLKIAVNNIITHPPQPGAIRKLLHDVVSVSQPAEGLVANVITAGDYDLNISDRSVKASVPWYSNWKETLMELNTSTFYSVNSGMLVVSSSEPDPVEQFLKLSQEQHRIQHSSEYSYPKWFIPNTLKYYVLLHDVSTGEEQRADSIYEEMKQRYGTQGCYLLKINSRVSNRGADEQIPDPWSQYLQKSTIQNQDSYEDYTVSNKNTDHLISDGIDSEIKDGLSNNFKTHPLQLDHPSGSLDSTDYMKASTSLQDSKKSNSGTPHGACLTLTDHDRIRQFIQEFTFRGLLPHIEKTIRQLNDQDSDLRSALLLEQAAHCFINMKSPMVRKFAFHMILAGHRFSKAGQKKHALRCYCQAMQVYKGKGWSLAEDHINFTIGRQSFTLRQLDNAVSAFRHILINDSKQPPAQQGAFLREYLYVYKNATQLSPDGPLPQLPLPYINSSATRVFFGHDRRPAEGEKQAATHVSLDQEYDSESSQQWKELEEQVVSVINKGTIPSNFQPTQFCLNRYSDNSKFPLAVIEEPITVEVSFRNPLKVPLLLTDLSLLWKFQPKDFSAKHDGETKEQGTCDESMVGTEAIAEFLINSEETKVARLKLFPHQTGELHILGVVYNLGSVQGAVSLDGIDPSIGLQTGKFVSNGLSVRGRQDLEIQGPRLNNTKEEKTSIKYGPDRRLDPIITEEMPLLEVFFINFPTGLLCGEIRKAYVEFVNVSKCPLTALKVVSKHPEFFTFGGNTAVLTPLSPSASENCSAYKTVVTDPTSVRTALLSSASSADFGVGTGGSPEVIQVPLPDAVLLPGASVQLPMWLRGPDEEGVHEINFLFYYESIRKHSKMCHRVLRHTAVICTSRSLHIRATVCRSNALGDEEGRGDNMLLFVDVENINTSETGVKEFHIVQVSSNSKHWKLQKSVNISGDKENYTFADIVFGNEQAYVVEDSKQLILEGQHHVALNTIGKEAFSFPQKQGFKKILGNSDWEDLEQAVVDVMIDLRHKPTSSEALEIHGSFTWLGQTQYKLQLKGQEVYSLQLKACFVHTGVYNLGTPRVFAKLVDQATLFETSQQNSMPALIIINNI